MIRRLFAWWRTRQALYAEAEAAFGHELPDLISTGTLRLMIATEREWQKKSAEINAAAAALGLPPLLPNASNPPPPGSEPHK